MIFGTFAASTPYLAGFLLLMIVCWIIAIRSLGKQFNTLVASQQNPVGEAELALQIQQAQPTEIKPILQTDAKLASN